jgi:hypothetical protein
MPTTLENVVFTTDMISTVMSLLFVAPAGHTPDGESSLVMVTIFVVPSLLYPFIAAALCPMLSKVLSPAVG